MLDIKTGELLAKTEDLKESSESLRLANQEIKTKTEEIKNTKKSLSGVEEKLITAIENLVETNGKFEINNKELVEANEKIKQLILKQKDFINIMAHEIRTPTQVILGYSEMLISEPHADVEYLKLIMQNAIRIKRLLSNILDLAKIDNDSLTLTKENFNLDSLVSSTIHDFKIQISQSKKNLNLLFDNKSQVGEEKEIQKGTFIEADRDRIAQVLINLLDNAIKYTNVGTIVVTINKNESHEDVKNSDHHKELIVSIKDVGRGLDSQFHSNVFLKSFSTSDSGGTGLGLFICKAIVEAHGGDIWVESNTDGKGVTFSFSLPLV